MQSWEVLQVQSHAPVHICWLCDHVVAMKTSNVCNHHETPAQATTCSLEQQRAQLHIASQAEAASDIPVRLSGSQHATCGGSFHSSFCRAQPHPHPRPLHGCSRQLPRIACLPGRLAAALRQ